VRKVVILGAGASAFYDSSRPTWERPPVGADVLTRGKEMGILSDPFFSELVEAAKLFAIERGSSPGTEFQVDIEELLAWIAARFQSHSEAMRLGTRPSEPFDSQLALGEATFFLYELLRVPIAAYAPRDDAYTRLARSYHKEQFGVISLNYDTLFDLAALHTVRGISYTPPVMPGSLPIAKLHGSVNWWNPLGRAVRLGGPGPWNPKNAMRLVWSNVFKMEPPMIGSPDAPKFLSWRDLLPNGENYSEVAIIPPVGVYKDFRKLDIYETVVNWARAMLGSSEEIVLIGTSIRRQDDVLRGLLKPALARKPQLTIVGGVDTVKKAIAEIEPAADVSTAQTYPTFEEYGRTL
jgi:hypothetical protein